MSTLSIILTVVSVMVAASSLAFAALYSRVTWWRSHTGRNQMAMAWCLTTLGLGTALRWMPFGGYVIILSAVAVAVVMVWRTVIMWQVTHPRNAPTPPVSPTEGPRQWYSPTPGSVIEPHQRKE